MDLFDLHCDSPYESQKRCESFINGNLAVTIDKGRVFGKWRQLCAIWIPDECKDGYERYKTIRDFFKAQIKLSESAEDLCQNRAFFLTLEGGNVINEISDVDTLYKDGIRVVTLTWNGKNKIAGGSNTNAPLSDFGREVINRMNELKMAVDLSHLNDRSFGDVIKCAEYPIATHVCCRDVYHVRRNMTDSQLVSVAKKGGIIGLCLYPEFLGEGDVFINFSHHLRHMLELGLADNVAVGSDFDGAKMDKTLDSVDKMPILYNYLINNGFDEEILSKLFFKNAEGYFNRLLK